MSEAQPSSVVARCFPSFVSATELDPREATLTALRREERAQVERAVSRRRQEFTAGRLAARAALSALHAPDGPLLMEPDRVPAWPAGFTGSISHARDRCVAVAARSSEALGVGVDVEEIDRVREALWRHLFTEREREALTGCPGAGRVATLFFCAKEALYKCQYTLGRGWLGFHDVEVALPEGVAGGGLLTGDTGGSGKLSVTLLAPPRVAGSAPVLERGTVVSVRYVFDGRHVIAGACLDA